MGVIERVGADWLSTRVGAMPDRVERMSVVEYNEKHRYLPAGVSPRPGYIRYDLFPFLREILSCFDPWSPVRECNLLKGVQVGYTTLLESVIFYYIGHLKSDPLMYITADKELAEKRIENNIIPMLNESDLMHLIRSSDIGNNRKTGKNKNGMQWAGGGFMIWEGAKSAKKMRQTSVPLMLKDELDGWDRDTTRDGNSDTLTDARLSAYWNRRKILRGSTPLVEPSMMSESFKRGDQRIYKVLCNKCSYPQKLKLEHVDQETGLVGGFKWELEQGTLLLESVRYCCMNCGHEHFEEDKERLFSTEHGAFWEPTARPAEPGIRSYQLPSWYSPFDFRPWSKGIADYLAAYDPVNKQVIDYGKYQEFYNNTLGFAFKRGGSKVSFRAVSGHRRAEYKMGQVPNTLAVASTGGPILWLTMQIDVHKRNLAVAVMGWTAHQRCFVIDYWRLERRDEDDDCSELSSPVWQKVRNLIEEATYEADDGTQYRIADTWIDAGFSNANVTAFCAEYVAGVYPVLGRDRPGKNQRISEFSEFETQAGQRGYKIVVDHYKDRLGPVLRRDWDELKGLQLPHHFNAPVDTSDAQIKELTAEYRKEITNDAGQVSYAWHRPGNVPNELFDLLVYGHAGVEIRAYRICREHFELETIDWEAFWEYAAVEGNQAIFGRLALEEK